MVVGLENGQLKKTKIEKLTYKYISPLTNCKLIDELKKFPKN